MKIGIATVVITEETKAKVEAEVKVKVNIQNHD